MVQLVFVRRRQMRAHAALVAGDDDAAATCRLRVVDAVLGAQPGVPARGQQDVGVFVAADAADEEG